MNRSLKSSKKTRTRSMLIYTLLPVAILLSSRWLTDLNWPPSYSSVLEQPSDKRMPENEPVLAPLTDADWRLILVNRDNPIPANYAIEQVMLDSGQAVDARIYPDLQQMMDAARKADIHPLVTSGYRTTKVQQQLMDDRVAQYRSQGHSLKEARTLAESWVAKPGTSEHELGIAVDINANKALSTNEDVYTWLHANSYLYGFILRYPADKTDITGVSYEPWHYRYVGKEAAADMYQQGLSLEEYVLLLAESGQPATANEW